MNGISREKDGDSQSKCQYSPFKKSAELDIYAILTVVDTSLKVCLACGDGKEARYRRGRLSLAPDLVQVMYFTVKIAGTQFSKVH